MYFPNSNYDLILQAIFFLIIFLCAIFGMMIMFKFIDLACPFCGKLEKPHITENKNLGLICKNCGEIKTRGFFLFRFTKENMTNGELGNLKIDLGLFTCGAAKLGDSLKNIEPFAQYLKDYETLNDETSGIEIGLKKGKFDYIFITMAKSNAKFYKSGTPIQILNPTTIADIKSIFGSPCWVDDDEGDVILFYEYDKGNVELQFEFPKNMPLSHITLMQNGVLSTEVQRKSYGVTIPWPPTQTSYR